MVAGRRVRTCLSRSVRFLNLNVWRGERSKDAFSANAKKQTSIPFERITHSAACEIFFFRRTCEIPSYRSGSRRISLDMNAHRTSFESAN